jgi:hypothetical protein
MGSTGEATGERRRARLNNEKGGEKDQDRSMLKEAAEGKRKSGQKRDGEIREADD